jgi:hypothetical protein
VPERVTFAVVRKGIATSLSYERDGELSENFSTPKADNVIELNGIKSELGIGYMLDFLIGVSPLGFLATWV